ncbi:hypothetical protein [Streptomyces sp. NPDC048419]|uniref:hypothetical protein n=1 Tax=Streptomyces sp. NPDC048419 TaxID=3365547 RepID=UPI003721BAD6
MIELDDPGPVNVNGRMMNIGVYTEPTTDPTKDTSFDTSDATVRAPRGRSVTMTSTAPRRSSRPGKSYTGAITLTVA